MDDFFDDFDDDFSDDFDENGYMDDDSFEDSFEDFEAEDSLDDDSGIENESNGDDLCDDEFTAKDAVTLGVTMGFAYEEGLVEGKRRKLLKKNEKDEGMDNKDDQL